MAEQLINEFTVNRPIDEAWPVLTDVERVASCLPGAELQAVEGETYRGVVKVKLGTLHSQLQGDAHLVDLDDERHRAVLSGAGRDTGGRGNASAKIHAQAEPLSPTSTKVTVTTDLHITGKVAQFGRGIMGDVSSKLAAQFAVNLNEMLDQQGIDRQRLLGPANGDGVDDATPASGTTTALGSGPRVIDGPATEPIDLMEVGGTSVLKRAIPAVLAVLVLVVLLRRRR